MYGEAGIITLARIKRENVHVVYSTVLKINEQNKSIGIGPLYLHTEFEAISLLLQKVMAGLNPVGYRTLQYWQGASARSQKVFYHREMV